MICPPFAARRLVSFALMLCALLWASGPAAAVSLSPTPLFLAGKTDPNLMFALSVEWPTAETAAYSDGIATDPGGLCPGLLSDANAAGVPGNGPSGVVGLCYYENQTYLGYFNPAECYTYSTANHVFNPSAAASSNHECSNAWSGNFLNWASMTTLDEFRWAMTGGTRDVDTAATTSAAGSTVLKRTYKTYGSNVYTMRVKRISASASTVGSSSVPGVPSSKVMPMNADTTVYIGSNNGNLYLWTTNAAAVSASSSGSGSTYCADEGGTCSPGGNATVWYGAGSKWLYQVNVVGDMECSNKAFGSDPNVGNSKTCYYKNTSSTIPTYGLASDGSVAIPVDKYANLVPLGGFQVRVAVCVPSAGLESNCSGYVNGTVTTYKPTGLLQSYSASMRFGVASYLYNSDPQHNGGVLRSNMKYVGLTSKDPVNGTTANANAEWDANGVFVANPNSADATNSGLSCSGTGIGCSGVINYINGFGYTSLSYMSKDVLSELYYESLRYFVNPANGPTQSYVTTPWNTGGLTASELDGFPAVTTWVDPIQYSCQKNAILTVGDANTWCDFNLPGSSLNETTKCGAHSSWSLANQAGVTENWANVTTFANKIGGYEGLGDLGTMFGPSLPDTYYIAGLAWWAHTHDIRPDLTADNKTTGFQNVTSYFIDVREPGGWGITGSPKNQYWLGAKYGGFTIHSPPSNAATAAGTYSNPAVSELQPATTSDWQVSSTTLPTTYFYGNQPLATITALSSLFSSIQASSGSAASLGSNGTSLQTGTQVYQPVANPSDWSGHLYARDVSSSGTLSSSYIDAGALLASPDATKRLIFTGNDATGAGIPFEWANLTSAQQALLNTSASGASDSLGQLRLNYIRGDASQEGGLTTSFRVRNNSKLGDILDSAPVYVGALKPDGTARMPMVYVGANDGMLHGFSAGAVGDTTTTAGTTMMQEQFAFIPSSLIGSLNQLPALSYSHQFYVDGSPQVAEVTIGSTAKTVLVGGLRAGGRALYALDITSPDTLNNSESAAAAALLWQFSNSQDSDLGYTYGEPQIIKTAAVDGSGKARWAAVIGNGYKPAQASGATNIQAALFLVFLDHPSGGNTWVRGTDYIKLLTSSSSATTSAPNGMATPAVVSASANGVASTIYAGDLYGHLWKFDISSSNPANWKSSLDSGSTAVTPLYTAQTSAGVLQPITTAPEVVKMPQGGYMVLFGTGQALASGDLASTAVQTIYGIWDNLSNTVVAGRATSSTILQQQQILSSSVAVTNSDGTISYYRSLSSNAVNYNTQRGWYLDLMDSPGATLVGERVVYNPSVYYGRVEFTTVIPDTSVCQTGGTSWTLSLSPYTGTGPNYAVFDVDGSGTFTAADKVSFSSGSSTITAYPAGVKSSIGIEAPAIRISNGGGCNGSRCHQEYFTSNSGQTASMLENDGTANSRASWREVPNDQ